MLHVYHSNRLEALSILLCNLRESRPVADPLTPETVLVANTGIGRWLNFQIAEQCGIAANIDYILPATFVWRLYQNCLDNVPVQSTFERGALQLHVLRELSKIADSADKHWLPLQRYAGTSTTDIFDTKCVQLAAQIANIFDQYLVYRPQMLLNWQDGSNDTPGKDPAQAWQPALWRRLANRSEEPHRAELWKQFCRRADNGEIDQAQLPEQIHLFNVGLLPPSTLDVLVRLGQVGSNSSDRVSMYFLNPSIDYWADLIDMRRAARDRLKLGGGAELLVDDQIGNPLLSSLGSSGRTLMKLLGDRSEWVHDEQFFLPPANDNLLSSVQRDLLHPYDDAGPADEETWLRDSDPSIQFHQCYSPMRELQALHDRLLDRFNADETLTPADVIVMVPDINRYAPVIEAVFGSVGGAPGHSQHARHIPWSVADRSLVQVSKIIACLQRLIDLPNFEFEATGVLAFAAEPAVARKFGFDDNSLKTLSQWLLESGVRRTLTDAGNQHLFKHKTVALHSWDFGLRRLLLGRAMPDQSAAVGDTLPCPQVEGQQAELLSQLINLVNSLADCKAQLQESRTSAEWVDTINTMISRVLHPDEDEADALAQFRQLLIDLDNDAVRAGFTDPITHASYAELLRNALAGAERKNHRYLTGRVTFSSMVPLRSVTFRVVCMLGLNDGDFPRQRANPGFDLITQYPEAGDRSVRDDDRYLFLEALLSAREELFLSWIYRNPADNAEREPSVIVSELRDYLKRRYPNHPPRVVEHPLQPFSHSLFNANNTALHTFAEEWAAPTKQPAPVSLIESGRKATPEAQISLDDFQSFWRDPSKWYCRRVLGISLWRDENEPTDAEPFTVNALESYKLRTRLTDMLFEDPDLAAETAKTHLRRAGSLPHGGPGDVVFAEEFDQARNLVDRITAHGVTPLSALDFELSINSHTLKGRLQNSVKWADDTRGFLHHHSGKLNGKRLCALWLDHLLGCAAGLVSGPSMTIGREDKDERSIAFVERNDALDWLLPWLEGWQHGQTNALPFFPNTSAVIAGALPGNAQKAWGSDPSTSAPGDSASEPVHLIYREFEDIPNREVVIDWANRLLGHTVLQA